MSLSAADVVLLEEVACSVSPFEIGNVRLYLHCIVLCRVVHINASSDFQFECLV